jgi:hypothetical protein
MRRLLLANTPRGGFEGIFETETQRAQRGAEVDGEGPAGLAEPCSTAHAQNAHPAGPSPSSVLLRGLWVSALKGRRHLDLKSN